MNNTLIIILALISPFIVFSQQTITLTFTAVDNASYVQLDSIKIMNKTLGADTVLYWPDTTLVLDYSVGIPESINNKTNFQVFQNYPNPVLNQTTLSMYVPGNDKVAIIITDILGRVIFQSDEILDQGMHSYTFIPESRGLFIFNARWRGQSKSIKILSYNSDNNNASTIEYNWDENSAFEHKKTLDVQSLYFNIGDTLLFVGYANSLLIGYANSLLIGYANSLETGILDTLSINQTYTFQFATIIPCPGTPIVEYEGQVYNTIQIFSQCWLKENLNVGWIIPGSGFMSDNGFIEKYCYNDEPDSCMKYGGLYQWDEMMQYTAQKGTQGICPPGWHIPTDEEWKVLEGAVDSQYGIGDTEWNLYNNIGHDVGSNLKTTSGWSANGNGSDLFDFSALPSGRRDQDGNFSRIFSKCGWWTSSQRDNDQACSHNIISQANGVFRKAHNWKQRGYSVRCIRDEVYVYVPTLMKLRFTGINNTTYIKLDSVKVMNRTQGGETVIHWPDTTINLPNELSFNPGDELLLIGYTDTLQSGVIDVPDTSQTCTLQFATNIPCPGIPTVSYEGQVYNTIQIFGQCWLKENLNVGMLIRGDQVMTDNDIIEKYCNDDDTTNCNIYGGLYQWDEMMQYTIQHGTQGICPPSWHLPTDEEWKVLEGAVDSQFGIGDPMWDYFSSRGYDAGTNLKTTSGWLANGNGSDLFGFSGWPSGNRDLLGIFSQIGMNCFWWTSTEVSGSHARYRKLLDYSPEVTRGSSTGLGKPWGFSVRCVKD